jgi:hypothetical protein
MNAHRQAQLQEALEAEAKIIRDAVNTEELDDPVLANFDEMEDALLEALVDSPDVMACLVRELFELVTGKEVED